MCGNVPLQVRQVTEVLLVLRVLALKETRDLKELQETKDHLVTMETLDPGARRSVHPIVIHLKRYRRKIHVGPIHLRCDSYTGISNLKYIFFILSGN